MEMWLLLHVYTCPEPTAYGVGKFMFNDLSLEVVVRFGHIGGIVDHHYKTFFS